MDRPVDHELSGATGDPGGQATAMCQVLSGLAGVGKTQAAAALAWRLWDARQVDLLVWVSAASRSAILARFADAFARVTGVDDAEHGAERFLAWLAEPHRHSWLVVLDNLDDPDDLTGLWPPVTVGGKTVVTTRRHDSALLTGRNVINVEVFTPAQATVYLRSKLADQPRRLEEAGELANDLGFLPLALAQAIAYIRDRGLRMTCARYRALLGDQRRRLADLAPDALPDQHRDTVAATWSLSIGLADEIYPAGLARLVLEFAAVLDPNGIPTAMFITAALSGYCARRLSRPIDADDLDDAVSTLERFGLANVDETTEMVRVHGLLQRVVRDTIDPARLAVLASTAADALLEIWPPVERDVAHCQPLRANLAVLRTKADTHLCASASGAHPVLLRATGSLGQVGLVTAAVSAYQQLLTEFLQVLGPEHLDTLTARYDLAQWLGEAGDPSGAVSALQLLLIDRQRIVGPDDPATLTTRHSIAFWLGRTGDLSSAIAPLERLLDDQLRILGSDHPDYLTTRHYLARWRGEAGDPAGAVSALQQLLMDRLRILGPDHPDTLITRHNLARWQGEAGDPVGAVSALQQLFNDRLRILGPDHPATLATRRNLADWLGEAGDPAGAVSALRQLLDDTLRVLGPSHYLTLFTRHHLARWRGKAGNAQAAVEELRALEQDQIRVLGPSHPDTLNTGSFLAFWRGMAGDPHGAVDSYVILLGSQKRVLGPEHPDTLVTRGNLAQWRGRAGDPGGAIAELRELLTDKLRLLGPDHPHTLAARGMLAWWVGEAGFAAEAVDMLAALVADDRQILGARHPHTQAAISNLDHWQGQLIGSVADDLHESGGP